MWKNFWVVNVPWNDPYVVPSVTIVLSRLWLTSIARFWARVPRSPWRPLSILRWWGCLCRCWARWQIDTNDLVVVVAKANTTAECGRWIRAWSSSGFHCQTARLGASRPSGPCGPTAVYGAICYFNFRTGATGTTVSRRGIIALATLTITGIRILRNRSIFLALKFLIENRKNRI